MAETTRAFQSAPVGGRAEQGAAAAFVAELFDGHARTVLAICRGLLRDPAEAEDAAQQTFLSAYRSLLAGSWPRDPAAWVATIARNECRTRIRERMREPLASPEPAYDNADPAAETIRRAEVRSLRRALADLPRNQQRAFVLRELGGLSYDELALALGVSAGAVESLLFRARRQLRGSLRSALAGVSGLTSVPLALRDLVARILAGGSAPVAVKVAAATGGAALVTAGAVPVANHDRALGHKAAPIVRHTIVRHVPRSRGGGPPPAAASAPVSAAAVEPAEHRGRGREVDHRGLVAEPPQPVEVEHAAPVAVEPPRQAEPEPGHTTVAPVVSVDSHDGHGSSGDGSLDHSGSGDSPDSSDGVSGGTGSGDSGSGG